MGGVKKILKGVGNVLTFGAVSAHDQAKAARKQADAIRAQTDAQVQAAEEQAQAAKTAAANTPQDQQEAMAGSIRDEEAARLRRRRGMTGTVLTGPLGAGGAATGSSRLGVM